MNNTAIKLKDELTPMTNQEFEQKLRNIGSDLGGAIKNFKKSVNDDDKANKE